jgi:L-aminopeptidase/D-esterase-like protein
MASAGVSRAVYPSNTLYDGDAVFAMSTGEVPKVDPTWLGAMAAEALARAIVESAKVANPQEV